MQRDEGAVDRQEADVPDGFREILSKGNLRRRTHRDPVVRCVPFKWTDRRKRKGYKRAGWLVEWREPGGKRFRKKFLDAKKAKVFASQKQAKRLNPPKATRFVQKPLTHTQLDEVEEVSRLRVEVAQVEVLSLDGATALLDHVAGFKAGKYVWYFTLALFAGIRPGGELEKLALHKELVDFKNRVIRLSGAISKTGKA